jgi:hypothetical protein
LNGQIDVQTLVNRSRESRELLRSSSTKIINGDVDKSRARGARTIREFRKLILRHSTDDVIRKNRHVMRSPCRFIVDSAMNRAVFAERLANHHPNQNNIPLLERGDVPSAERLHAGTASFS